MDLTELSDAELDERIHKFAKYYYKGAGNCLVSIRVHAEQAYKYKEKTAENIMFIQETWNKYFSNYPKIDIEHIKYDEAFWCIHTVTLLNSKLNESITNFIKNPRFEQNFSTIRTEVGAILCAGELFFDAFYETFTALRSRLGKDNYNFNIKDINGVPFSVSNSLGL
jgi:hypothetical protein